VTWFTAEMQGREWEAEESVLYEFQLILWPDLCRPR